MSAPPDEALWDDAEHRDNKAETDEADPDKAYPDDAEDGYEDLDGDEADVIAPRSQMTSIAMKSIAMKLTAAIPTSSETHFLTP